MDRNTITESTYELREKHHEIHLTNPQRSTPEKKEKYDTITSEMSLYQSSYTFHFTLFL